MKNIRLFKKARKILVGGVNSPVRSFRSVGGIPVFMKKGKGAYLFGENGKRHLDFCLSWGAAILGHAPESVVQALKKTISCGTSFGAATAPEIELAERIRKGIPSMERIRFTNSGTEAVMSALRLARAFTKRDQIIQFDGCYHGHGDSVIPESAGVPRALISATRVLPYNDLARVERIFRKEGKKIAAVIVEPVTGNMGVIFPRKGFLAGLRKLCDRHGALLIFDEVITGFRFCYGGAQNYFGVTPDLTTLGKIIGGGLPIGAFGGKKEIMKLLAPEGPVYQAGTFSGNPLSMAAGIAALKQLARPGVYQRLWENSQQFYEELSRIALKAKTPVQLNAFGPMFSIFFTPKAVWNAADARAQDVRKFRKFFHALLKQGIYFSPSPFEANFLSITHLKRELRKTLAAFGKAVERLAER